MSRKLKIDTGEPKLGPYTPGINVKDHIWLSGQIDIESGDDWSWTFEEEGTFSYYSNKAYDKDFEGDPKVKGQVIVKDPAFDFEWDI